MESPRWRGVRTGLLAAGCAAAALAVAWLALRGPQLLPPPVFSSGTNLRGAWSGAHLLVGLALSAVGTGAALLAGLRPRLPAASVGPAVIAPLAGLALATVAAVYPAAARTDLAAALAFVLALVALTAACPGRRWQVPAGLLGGIGLAEAAVAIEQFARGRPTPAAWTGPAAARIPLRVYGTLHNPNALAALLLLAAGGTAALALAAAHPTWRQTARIALVPLALAFALTFSRAAYIGLLAGAGVTAIALPATHRRPALVLAAAVALGLGLATVAAPAVAWRATRLTPATAGDWQAHLFEWRVALAIWRSHPWLGAGPGGVAVLYGIHEPPGAGGTYALVVAPGAVDGDALQWLANTGLVGGALAAAGLARRPRRRLSRPLGAAVLAIALATAFALRAPWAGERALAAGWRAWRTGRPTAYRRFQTAAQAAPRDAAAQAAAADAALRWRRGRVSIRDATARADLGAALRLNPYDGGTWDLAGALLSTTAHPEAAACAQQAAASAAPYNPFFAGRLARALAAAGHPAAGRADAAYALSHLPSWLRVYAEHPRSDAPFSHLARADGVRYRRQAAGAAAPARPLRPLPPSVCEAHLARAGLPSAAYRRSAAASRRP